MSSVMLGGEWASGLRDATFETWSSPVLKSQKLQSERDKERVLLLSNANSPELRGRR